MKSTDLKGMNNVVLCVLCSPGFNRLLSVGTCISMVNRTNCNRQAYAHPGNFPVQCSKGYPGAVNEAYTKYALNHFLTNNNKVAHSKSVLLINSRAQLHCQKDLTKRQFLPEKISLQKSAMKHFTRKLRDNQT